MGAERIKGGGRNSQKENVKILAQYNAMHHVPITLKLSLNKIVLD